MADYPQGERPLRPEQYRPSGLDLRLVDQTLRVTWADGVLSEFPLPLLRRHCPCATCRSERDKPSLLPILSTRQTGNIRVVGGEVVGNYAIRFDWSDGHNTGIYDFRLLRDLHENGQARTTHI